jgi:hypothetical protein
MLFNHLAYAAMRCSDQGFITMDQLLAPIALGTQADCNKWHGTKKHLWYSRGQRVMRLFATVDQQLADRLQDCRQFVRGEKAELGIKAPTPPLTNLPADKRDNTAVAGKETVGGSTLAPVTPESRVDGVRRSRRIAAARSMTLVAADTAISNMEQGPTRELICWQRLAPTRRKQQKTMDILTTRKVKTLNQNHSLTRK